MQLDAQQGRFLVETARMVVEEYVLHMSPIEVPADAPDALREKAGVFVTLATYPDRDLRGCIGHPYADSPLLDALFDSAVSACSKDPRFQPVRKDELDGIVVEVTVLTPPQVVRVRKPSDLPKQVEVGRHGLIVRKGWYQGLLLPQVPVEQGWDAEEFLSQTCRKAGLPMTAWIDEDTEVSRFEGFIFGEEKPKGEVVRKD
jgi:uncharacterized protein (TIGR00296 family)